MDKFITRSEIVSVVLVVLSVASTFVWGLDLFPRILLVITGIVATFTLLVVSFRHFWSIVQERFNFSSKSSEVTWDEVEKVEAKEAEKVA